MVWNRPQSKFCISQCSVKKKHDKRPCAESQQREQIPAVSHICVTLTTNRIRCFNTQPFIIMLRSSKLFTIATSFFATIQATNITTRHALEQEKAGTQREGTLQDIEKGSTSSTSSPLLLQELKRSIFI